MLQNYSYEVDKNGYPLRPLHNEYSHLADAFRYAILYFHKLLGQAPRYGYGETEKDLEKILKESFKNSPAKP